MGKRVDWYNADGLRFCSGCQDYMDVALFHRSRARPDGLSEYCRLCRHVRRRADYARNRDKEIAAAREWQAAHPERAHVNQRRAYRVWYRLRKLTREAQRIKREERAG